MNTINCFVLDDEIGPIKILKEYISDTPNLKLYDTSTDPVKSLEVFKQRPDLLVFLDVDMPKISGLDLMSIIDNPVILTTAYKEYAVDGFNLEARDFLLKPIAYSRFLKAIDKVSNSSVSEKMRIPDHIFISVENREGYRKVNLCDIIYIESQANYVIIHTGHSKVKTRMTLKEMEEQLPRDAFQRVHLSFIVSIQKVVNFTSSKITLSRGEDDFSQITIGRTYYSNFQQSMNKFAFPKK